MFGLGGDDDLPDNRGNDTIRGGTGKDRLLGHSGNGNLCGDVGADPRFEETGNGVLEGGSGIDRLDGGLGNDAFVAGAACIALPALGHRERGARFGFLRGAWLRVAVHPVIPATAGTHDAVLHGAHALLQAEAAVPITTPAT
jgi:hypothetical protein